jgi:long-chain acyl-CoA synthetase
MNGYEGSNDLTLLDTVQRHRDGRPDSTAFCAGPLAATFADFDLATNRIANALLALGLGKADRIACLTRHHIQCFELMLAACKIGAVCVPVNWRLSASEVEYIVNHSQAQLLVVDEAFIGKFVSVDAMQTPMVRLILCTERAFDRCQSFNQWISHYGDQLSAVAATADDPALQLYSSGTTGLPKGVVLSHGSLMSAARVISKDLGFDHHHAVSNLLPTFHISGILMLLVSLYTGGKTCSYSEFDPKGFIDSISRDGITHAVLVPAMILFVLQSPAAAGGDFRTLKLITYGGSPISEQLLQDAMRVFGCDFLQIYGLTEVAGAVSVLPPDAHRLEGSSNELLRSAGKAAEGARLRIVDATTLKDLAPGEIGEIWVESVRNLTEYWRDVEATAQVFPEGRNKRGGWFRTGDSGYLQDGYLFIKDRLKDMIISGGENIYPAEIENLLAKHPSIADCAIIGVPDAAWGESVKACIVLKSGVSATERDIIEWTRSRLAHFKCPKSVDFLEVLPRNPSGKILKRALREPYWKGKQRAIN